MGDTFTSILIEEVTGQQRSVELVGSGMPKQGAEWGSLLKVVTTWYPGNDQATQQVLGPRDPPSKWEGRWARTMLSRSPCIVKVGGQTFNVVAPHELRDVLEAIQRAGARLRATWQATSPDTGLVSLVREGRITSVTFKYDRITDINWELDFEWVGRGNSTQRVASTRDGGAASTQDALASTLTNFTNSLEQSPVITSKGTHPFTATSFSLGQLESLATAPLSIVQSVLRTVQQKVSDLQQIGQIATTVAGEPFAIADAASSMADDIVGVTNVFSDEITAQPAEQQSKNHDTISVLRAAQTFGQVNDQARVMARGAQQVSAKVKTLSTRNPGGRGPSVRQTSALAAGGLRAVHVTRSGDTPQRLSIRFYRTPDHAVDILFANKLPWTTVTFDVGTTLIIPALPKKKTG